MITKDNMPPLPTLAAGGELTADTFADFVQRLRYHVRGEGARDHCTADAIFLVQARRIIFGIDRAHTDQVAVLIEESMYFSPQEYWDGADEDTRAELEKMADGSHEKPFLECDACDQWEMLECLDDHTVSGWQEEWEFVNAHLTKDAADAFIRRKKHDYPKGLRVYVDAQSYCWEFNAIVGGLLDGRITHAAALEARVAELEWKLAQAQWCPECHARDSESDAFAAARQSVEADTSDTQYLTVVYRTDSNFDHEAVINNQHMTAASWSHAIHARDVARAIAAQQPAAVDRDAILEEAAKVCESRFMGDLNREDIEARRCAADIRTLKVKPITTSTEKA